MPSRPFPVQSEMDRGRAALPVSSDSAGRKGWSPIEAPVAFAAIESDSTTATRRRTVAADNTWRR